MLQRWLAAWFAVLLAVAPFTRPSVPVELAAFPAASPEALVAQDHAQGKKPVAGVLPAQPFTPGILSRLALLDTTFGLPPVKPPLLRPAADQPLLAIQTTTALGGETRSVFQRSSVGTARTPTGPPA
jgi:hypothetical protein